MLEQSRDVGTPMYMAPEIWDGSGKFGFKVDVYAFGMIMYAVWTGSMPYRGMKFLELGMKIQSGNRPEMTSNIPSAYQSLIARCWDPNPDSRPSFTEVVECLKDMALENELDIDKFQLYQQKLDNVDTSTALSSSEATGQKASDEIPDDATWRSLVDRLVDWHIRYSKVVQSALDSEYGLRKILTKKQSLFLFSRIERLFQIIIDSTKSLCTEQAKGLMGAELSKCFPAENLKELGEIAATFRIEGKELLDKLQTNKKFRQFCTELKDKDGTMFERIVHCPVENLEILRGNVKLILKEIPESHSDHEPLQEIANQLEAVCTQLWDKVDEADRISKILEIQNSIKKCPKLLVPKRNLVGTWELDEQQEIVILSDLVLVVKKKTLVDIIDLKCICDVVEIDQAISLSEKTGRTIVLKVERPDARTEALRAIQKAIVDLKLFSKMTGRALFL